jgi:hypothetical protein
MSIKSTSLLKCHFLLHISVIYDNHQAFINRKMHLHSLPDCASQWIIAVSLVIYNFNKLTDFINIRAYQLLIGSVQLL